MEVCDYMKESYERLEFFGDAVLNLVSTDLIFHKYPKEDEGFMTRLRTKIVRGTNCAIFAKKINLGAYILIGTNISRVKDSSGIITNDKILEDAFESIMGALFIDLGLAYAQSFLLKLISENINFDTLTTVDDNFKDIIMRYTQTFKFELPIYEVISIDGMAHNKMFNVSVSLKRHSEEKKLYGIGYGKTKKIAEQNACKNSLCGNLRDQCTCSKIHTDEISCIINREYVRDENDDSY